MENPHFTTDTKETFILVGAATYFVINYVFIYESIYIKNISV